MSSQLLINVLTVTVPAGGVVTVPHGLRSNDKPVAPKLVLPEAPSTVSVVTVTDTSITFANAGEEPVTTKFRVERGLSVEVDAEELSPFYQRVDGAGGGGGGTVTVVNTGAGLTGGPIITSGTIDVDFGSTAGTVCEGNDVRLSNSRPPNGAAGGNLTGTYPNPTIANLAVTDAKVATANKDGTAATPSMRTLGTGAQQACAGNDARLSNTRTPTPLVPSPAGVYGAPSFIPVVTVNSAGQITSAYNQAATPNYMWGSPVLYTVVPNTTDGGDPAFNGTIPVTSGIIGLKANTVDGVPVRIRLIGAPTFQTAGIPLGSRLVVYAYDENDDETSPPGTGPIFRFENDRSASNPVYRQTSLKLSQNFMYLGGSVKHSIEFVLVSMINKAAAGSRTEATMWMEIGPAYTYDTP